MTRILFGLLFFPLMTSANDLEDASSDIQESPKAIVVEVTVLEVSKHIEFADAPHISTKELQQTIAGARSSGALEYLTSFRLATISGQEAKIQVGAVESFITGWTQTGIEKIPIYQSIQAGSVLSVSAGSPVLDKITVSLTLSQSRLIPGELEDKETAKLDFPTKREFELKTIAIIPNGKTVRVSTTRQNDGDESETIVLVHAATID